MIRKSFPTLAITAFFLCSCGIIESKPKTTVQLIKVNEEYLGRSLWRDSSAYWQYIQKQCLKGAIVEEAFKRDFLEKGAVVITAVPYEEIISIRDAPEEAVRWNYDGKCKGTRYTVNVEVRNDKANTRLLGPS